MSLYQVAAPAPPAAMDVNQVVNLLTGKTTWYQGAALNVATTISASLNGATAASRFVGGIAQGPPTATTLPGTWLTGDWLIDAFWQVLWICTAGGTPGTWAQVGAGDTGRVPLEASVGQVMTARSGRTGFDIIRFDTPVGYAPASLYDPNAFGYVAPYPCTVRVDAVLNLQGPSGVNADCAAYILQNGTPVLFGDECYRGQSPALGVSGIVRCAAGDILQVAVYAEAAYVLDPGAGSVTVCMMGS